MTSKSSPNPPKMRPWPPPGPLPGSLNYQTSKKMHFLSKMVPFGTPIGTQKSSKALNVAPKDARFTSCKPRLRIRRFWDPPEPSKLSSRLHKTSIFTFWPYPENSSKISSKTRLSGTFGHQKGPNVRKNRTSENAGKNKTAENTKRVPIWP